MEHQFIRIVANNLKNVRRGNFLEGNTNRRLTMLIDVDRVQRDRQMKTNEPRREKECSKDFT